MDYKEIIESRYNRQNWQTLLHDIFGNKVKFWSSPSEVTTSSHFAKQALWLGTISLSDEQTISIYEVELSDNVDIERNRRGIRDMLLIDWRNNGNAGAFMFCYRKNESVLRFSYVSESWTFAEDGTYQKESTDTKRFTYLLGEGHRSRTAIQQFETLKKSGLSLKDLTKAFSVDAVSDMFFKGYKQQYEDIIFYVTGKRMVKVANKWEERMEGTPNQFIMQQFSKFPNPEKAIRDYVKKLMGRLVFLQFLQKKGWLGVPVNAEWGSGDSEFIQNLFAQTKDKDHFIDDVLELLFKDLNTEREGDISNLSSLTSQLWKIPYLNGGLFEREATDETDFPLPAKYMQSMLEFFASYNFTIDENDPDDAEVGVDPEMLGRIFENLLEDNKDKGAFYTPKEIVTYMCRESLIAYLQTDIEDEATKEAIRQFVTTHHSETLGTNDKFRQQVDEALKEVKICDPAIGSGAFPMGLLKELFLCRTALEGFEQSKAAEIKKHIIQKNIYGVDIERGAVDIARLRFWLSLIVDEETPHALPNLDFKIMQGNSLLEQYKGVDLSTMTEKKADGTGMLTIFDNMLDVFRLDLRKMLDEYYNCTDHNEKLLLRKRIIDNVKQQLKEQTINIDFGNLDLSGNDQFMLWHTWFYDVFFEGGFDIVIANPPYIGEKGHKEIFQPVKLDAQLGKFYLGKMDYFYFFFHFAFNTLNKKGVCTFITTNYYLTALGAKKLRLDIKDRAKIKSLLNLGELKLFENALGQHNIISTFTKDDNFNKCTIIDVHKKGALSPRIFESILSHVDRDTLYDTINQENIYDGNECYIRLHSDKEDSTLASILHKISSINDVLGNIAEVNAGIMGGCDSITNHNLEYVEESYIKEHDIRKGDGVFVLDRDNIRDRSRITDLEKYSFCKDFYKNSDIKKYSTNISTSKLIIFSSSDTPDMDQNKIRDFLQKYSPILTRIRNINNENIEYWHQLRRGTAHPHIFTCEKIVCPQRSKVNTFGYNAVDWYASADVYYITNPDKSYNLKYILGILNSKLYYVWLYNKGKRKGETLELYQKPLSEIPIKRADDNQQKMIIDVVDTILDAKNSNPQADTSIYENKIDFLVYKLYGLTYDEVLIVDPETPITREEYESGM